MGLDISAGTKDWHASYGGFNRIREHLGELAGVPLHEVKEHFTKGLYGFWYPNDTVPDDLIFLQAHYDCEGILMPYTAEKIAARVRTLLSASTTTDPDMRAHILEFVELLEHAAEEYEVVMFS